MSPLFWPSSSSASWNLAYDLAQTHLDSVNCFHDNNCIIQSVFDPHSVIVENVPNIGSQNGIVCCYTSQSTFPKVVPFVNLKAITSCF